MSTFVLLEARIQPEKISEMKSSMEQILPETRSYDGCQGIDALFNVDEPGSMVLVEQWESRSHHDKYLQWRTETGVMAKLASMLVGAPSMRYFESVNA